MGDSCACRPASRQADATKRRKRRRQTADKSSTAAFRFTSIDMATALHPQTLLVLDFPGKPGETKYGYPIRIRIPTKLGFKNPKFVAEIFVTNDYPGGYWENQGYNWFSGS
jgi:DMSO/TMAO reductase YedYZ molybdopterin-dependent catalytic subunit